MSSHDDKLVAACLAHCASGKCIGAAYTFVADRMNIDRQSVAVAFCKHILKRINK